MIDHKWKATSTNCQLVSSRQNARDRPPLATLANNRLQWWLRERDREREREREGERERDREERESHFQPMILIPQSRLMVHGAQYPMHPPRAAALPSVCTYWLSELPKWNIQFCSTFSCVVPRRINGIDWSGSRIIKTAHNARKSVQKHSKVIFNPVGSVENISSYFLLKFSRRFKTHGSSYRAARNVYFRSRRRFVLARTSSTTG
jgi:hypothetical protein